MSKYLKFASELEIESADVVHDILQIKRLDESVAQLVPSNLLLV